jgi:RNA recognition motif-containing protein
MEVKVCVRNLSKSTTQKQWNILFELAGDVTVLHLSQDPKSGESKRLALITMSAQSEADKAVRIFDSYSLVDHLSKVNLVKPREQRGFGTVI